MTSPGRTSIRTIAPLARSSRLCAENTPVKMGAIDNESLPTFVANYARTSAHLYAFSKFATLKDWRRAATSLKHIYHHSPMLASDVLYKLILSKAKRAARRTLSKAWPVREQKRKSFRKFEEIDPLVPLVGGWSRFRTKALFRRLSEIDRSGECSAATSSQEA